jgi:hypothetical protein
MWHCNLQSKRNGAGWKRRWCVLTKAQVLLCYESDKVAFFESNQVLCIRLSRRLEAKARHMTIVTLFDLACTYSPQTTHKPREEFPLCLYASVDAADGAINGRENVFCLAADTAAGGAASQHFSTETNDELKVRAGNLRNSD